MAGKYFCLGSKTFNLMRGKRLARSERRESVGEYVGPSVGGWQNFISWE